MNTDVGPWPLRLDSTLLFLRERNRGSLKLLRQPRFVPGLQHARAAQQRPHGVRRQRAVVEPVVGAVLLDLEAVFCLTRMVVADDFHETPIARARAVGDDNAVVRLLLAADTAETNSNCHFFTLVQVVVHCIGLIATPEFPVRTRVGLGAWGSGLGGSPPTPQAPGPRPQTLSQQPRRQAHSSGSTSGCFLHHLLHLLELVKEPVHLVHRTSGTLRNTGAP